MKYKVKSIWLKITAVLIGIVFLGCVTLFVLFYNEVNTLMSIKKINNKPA